MRNNYELRKTKQPSSQSSLKTEANATQGVPTSADPKPKPQIVAIISSGGDTISGDNITKSPTEKEAVEAALQEIKTAKDQAAADAVPLKVTQRGVTQGTPSKTFGRARK